MIKVMMACRENGWLHGMSICLDLEPVSVNSTRLSISACLTYPRHDHLHEHVSQAGGLSFLPGRLRDECPVTENTSYQDVLS